MSVFSLLERLTPHIEREVNLIINPNQEAETLSSKLKKIEKGLQDAERQGVTDLNVKCWLKELEDVMYEMDDALDKWQTKNLGLQIEQSEYDDMSDPWEKVRSPFLSLCFCFKHVVERRELTQEMKALSERLDRILEEKGRHSFVPNKNDKPQDFKQDESTSFVDKSEIYGRDFEKDSLVDMLLSKVEENGTQVIFIVGIGGVGKTTLAQLAYNDPRIAKHFDLKAWVSMPDIFDASLIGKAILENVQSRLSGASMLETIGQKDVGNSSSGGSTLEALGQRIEVIVSKKRFLLVLDNVWIKDHSKWESLKNCLVGALHCRILVTTRSEIAARMIGTVLWRLSSLSDIECGRILHRIALDGRSQEEQEKFRDVGLEIAKKCNGLPLAARTVGSMLASRFTVQEWQDVQVSPLWKYEDEMIDISRLFMLSYIDLSPLLKRCFLSCVLYSKGSWFHSNELTRIWMAQGYISSSAMADEVQFKGMQFFQNLFVRCFFQELEIDEANEGLLSCKMHDVMHDFANSLSKSEHYFIIDGRTGQQNLQLDSMERIRYFCLRFVSQQGLPSSFLSLLICVRVLCLSNCNLKELSQEVGKLIHLRLPHGIRKLINLRHLHIYDTYSLRQYPAGLEKLTSLWTLDYFRATRDSVGYLRNLNQLRGSLAIRLEDLNEAAEAKKANLRNKTHIKGLVLIFYEKVSMDVIEAMVPPPQLQTLTIIGFGNLSYPGWITTSLKKLKNLTLIGFDDCSDLPPLGELPMLEILLIKDMHIRTVTPEFWGIPKGSAMGGFPKLKKLRFYNCELWEEWEDMEEEDSVLTNIMPMPCLQELELYNCPKLKALPHGLLRMATSLKNLIIDKSELLGSRYDEESGADFCKISQVPDIRIWRRKSQEMNNA